ncbi:proline and serine-rich protein 2 isoform X2 [Ambystoma mexicanum]|uniref:proline and serine-rich protein 2 isoform X2 n=1 Tax=Ambystoma mexicanum TaxID=8296 RepID=UPI0037E8245A
MFDLKQEDENLKYLSRDEQSALLFFEETLKSFQDDLTVNGTSTPQLLAEAAFSDSEPEDIIDLVTAVHKASELKEEAVQEIAVSCDAKVLEQKELSPVKYSLASDLPRPPTMNPSSEYQAHSPENPVERQKLLGAVPTPVIVAEHISNLSPTPLKADRLPVQRRDAATSPPPAHKHYSYPSPPSDKIGHYPNNISICKVGKEYNKTISMANVNVSQRRAQVLAHLHTEHASMEEVGERMHPSQMIGRNRGASFKDGASQQAKYQALIKLQLIKETPVQVDMPAEDEVDHSANHLPYTPTKPLTNGLDNVHKVLTSGPTKFIPVSKTITIPGATSPTQKKFTIPGATSPTQKKFTRTIPSHTVHECTPARLQNEIKRSPSVPRPNGFWSQGISVQFSGRGATEESRKEALQRLGLLKKTA